MLVVLLNDEASITSVKENKLLGHRPEKIINLSKTI